MYPFVGVLRDDCYKFVLGYVQEAERHGHLTSREKVIFCRGGLKNDALGGRLHGEPPAQTVDPRRTRRRMPRSPRP